MKFHNDDFDDGIKLFLSGPLRNAWLEFRSIRLYVRKSRRVSVASGNLENFIDVGNALAHEMGNGVFTNFLNTLEKNGVSIFIECVLSERLQKFLERRGYEKLPMCECACYQKHIVDG